MKESWRVFKEAVPGVRFVESYERRQHAETGRVGKLVSIGLGVALIAAGLVGLVAPGPGLLGLAFGAALIAREFEWAARRLDALELKLRAWADAVRRWWKSASGPVRGLIVLVAAGLAGGAAYGAYRFLFGG